MSSSQPRDLNELRALAKGTKYESIAGDRQKLEELLIQEIKGSKDPVLREIGSGLADGSMTWRTVVTSSAYADYLSRGMDKLTEVDLNEVFEAARAEQAAQEPKREPRPPRDEEPHERDTLFKGFAKKRKRR